MSKKFLWRRARARGARCSPRAPRGPGAPKLQIGGTTYTKWLWGNLRDQGAMYNFTTIPGEGYGDNGQGTELELLLNARLSSQVEVRGRIHSRFSQNFWTNFGGFGGATPSKPVACRGRLRRVRSALQPVRQAARHRGDAHAGLPGGLGHHRRQ